MATAFHDDGSVDLDGTAAVARATSSTTATTASSSPAPPGSRRPPPPRRTARSCAAVKDAVGDRATRRRRRRHQRHRALDRARRSRPAKIGADGVLLVTPYYNKPGQRRHPAPLPPGRRRRRAAGDALRHPGPHRQPRSPLETYAAMAAGTSVVAVKDAVGDLPAACGSCETRATPSTPATTSPTSAGWPTAPSASSPWSATSPGDELRAMIDAVPGRRPRRAPSTIYTRLLPAIDAVMGVANYGATTAKAALQLLGVLDNRTVRAPLVRAGRRRGRRAARGPRPRPDLLHRKDPHLEPPRTPSCPHRPPGQGRPAGHPARRARRGRPQHDRLRVRRPAADRRLRRAVPRGPPPRRRPDPPRLRPRSGTGSTTSRRWC